MSTEQSVFMICRPMSDGSPKPGPAGGYQCRGCAREVYVSREGRAQIAHVGEENAMLLCTSCGEAAMQLFSGAMQSPVGPGITVQFNPEAVDQIEQSTGKPVLDVFPGAKVSFDPLGALRNPKRRSV
jgi:hypothetical protein